MFRYKKTITGQRIVAFALRRKDAVMLGLGAEYPTCGDIIYCMAEGYEHDHQDVAPSGLRMPVQCEGFPVYQIFSEEV